jgi:hypothetical protein
MLEKLQINNIMKRILVCGIKWWKHFNGWRREILIQREF